VSCALHLQRCGFNVTLVDRLEPGEATSFGNAGVLASHGIIPAATPGILAKIPKMLLDPMGPLSLRWPYAAGMGPWFWKFLANASPQRVAHISDALALLTLDTVEQHMALAQGTPAESLIKPAPTLNLYRNEAAYKDDDYGWKIRRKHGARTKILQGRALADYDPSLSGQFSFGVVMEDYGYVLDPAQVVKGLAAGFAACGGKFIKAEVKDIDIVDGAPKRLVLTGEALEFDRVVIAAGAWSAKLAKKLGSYVPLEAERGYHITLTDPGIMPAGPVMATFGKFIATPMAMGLRLAGLVEFGGLEAPPNYARAETLLKHAKILFPDVQTKHYTQWMGHRPSLPDSLPVVGQSPVFDNVYFAFGHQHLGLTMGPKTGRLIAELLLGRKPNVDLSPFRVDRF
jgi:D-amino-acid dehydrogenase